MNETNRPASGEESDFLRRSGLPAESGSRKTTVGWRRSLLQLVVTFVLLGVALWLAVPWLETRLTFQPQRSWDLDVRNFGGEELRFESADGTALSGAWFPLETGEPRGVLLHCSGNAGNLSHRVGMALAWRQLGFHVLLFDYRGYGRSEGTPSEQGLLLDAEAAYREAARRGGGRPVVSGRSLGTVPATHLAATVDPAPRGLLLDSPMASAKEMAGLVLPIPGVPNLITLRLDNERNVTEIRCPLFVLHGDEDEVIPIDQGRRVFDRAPEPKEFLIVAGGRHNDLRTHPRVEGPVKRFLHSLPSVD